MRECAERDLLTGIGPDIDILEGIGTLLELLRHLHYDVVLVNPLIHRRYLPLAKCIVERIIDRLWTQAQPRSGIAINYQVRLQCAALQIAINILKFRNRSQLLLNNRRKRK